MKYLLSLSLIFVLSCSHLSPEQKSSPLKGLEAMMSPEDLKIHQCLHSESSLSLQLKQKCLKGTAYEGMVSRVPSMDEDDIIMKNNWFFGDNTKIEDFYNISRGFVNASAKMAKGAIEDRGIAVEGHAFFGFGAGWLAEFINHHEQFGLFCAPFYSVKTDIGLEAAVAVVQSLSCTSNEAYQGGFLNINAGFSGELIGIPADLSVAYSFGLDLPAFAQKIRAARAAGKLKVTALSKELSQLAGANIRRGITTENQAAILSLALRPLSILGVRPPSLATLRSMNKIAKDAVLHHKSLGQQFKKYNRDFLSPYLLNEGLTNVREFLNILTSSMTGCDSIGGAASLSLSVSPVAVGVAYENYQLLFEMPFEDLRALKVVTPLILMNPFLMNPEDLRATVRIARGILAIPLKVQRQCNQVFPRI